MTDAEWGVEEDRVEGRRKTEEPDFEKAGGSSTSYWVLDAAGSRAELDIPAVK